MLSEQICNLLSHIIISCNKSTQIFIVAHLLTAHLALINIGLYTQELLLNLAVITIQDIHMHDAESVEVVLRLKLIQSLESLHGLSRILCKIDPVHSEIKICSCNSNLAGLITLLSQAVLLIISRSLRLREMNIYLNLLIYIFDDKLSAVLTFRNMLRRNVNAESAFIRCEIL